MKKLIIISILSLFIVSCDKTSKDTNNYYDIDKLLVKNSYYYYSENPDKLVDSKISGGKYDSEMVMTSNFTISFNSVSGQIYSGKREGIWYFVDILDTICISKFKNNKLNGELRYYYNNGQLWSHGNFTDGLRNGKFFSYYDNGHVETETYYVNDKLDGLYMKYDKNGDILNLKTYSHGKLIP